MAGTGQQPPRELAARTSDGVDVRLVWSPDENAVFVVVTDERVDDQFAIPVDPARALDAYQHPYLYLELTATEPVGAAA
ncbi:MAG TPA: hypothetical protein VFH74_03605 [Gaiellales bacterium]|nr:hypothetical protein [Gaiellales bacterium]